MSVEAALAYIFSFIFGSLVGSFLNVCIYRIPNKLSIISPPSHCPSCKTPIKFYNNIPILSYFILSGRCSSCGAGFSPRYMIIEALTAVMFVAIAWKFDITMVSIVKEGISVEAIMYFVLIPTLIVITFIDIDHYIIPNVISFPGIVVGLLFGIFRTDWKGLSYVINSQDIGFWDIVSNFDLIPALDSLFGIVFGGGVLLLIGVVYRKLRGREGMGMGDVKLLAMLGAFLGATSLLFIIITSSLIGSIVGLSIMFYKKEDMKAMIPFGPFLSLGAVLYLFIGGYLISLLGW